METLRGQFLVAMPGLADEDFRNSLIYVVGHGDEGAMGLMVNQPVADMRFGDVLEELSLGGKDEIICLPRAIRDREVLHGGPVQRGRGFVLHSPDYFREENSYVVHDDVCLTATVDILKSMAFKAKPIDAVFALGYCGWAPGQLEGEIALNGWLTVPYSRGLMFGTPYASRYDLALKQLGITWANLSTVSGHA